MFVYIERFCQLPQNKSLLLPFNCCSHLLILFVNVCRLEEHQQVKLVRLSSLEVVVPLQRLPHLEPSSAAELLEALHLWESRVPESEVLD